MNIKHSISIVQLSRGRGTAEGSKGRAYFAGVQTPSPQSLAPNTGSEFVASRRLGSPQGERNATKKACHSTKRTHFFGGAFLVYHPYSKMLMSFADGFANGFVLKKRTHFLGGSEGSLSLKSGFVSGKRSHWGSRDGTVPPTFIGRGFVRLGMRPTTASRYATEALPTPTGGTPVQRGIPK